MESEWYKKYGQGLPSIPNKSALTPTEPRYFLHDLLTKGNALKSHLMIEAFQREKLLGFLTSDLIKLDAISSRKLKKANLENPILPSLEMWDNKNYFNKIPFGEPNSGVYWDADRDEIWDIISPSLQLATRFISSSLIEPFLETILLSSLEDIPPERLPPGTDHDSPEVKEWKIIRRPEIGSRDPEVKNKIIKMFKQMNDNLQLSFFDGRVNMYGDPLNKEDQSNVHAETTCLLDNENKFRHMWIRMNWRDFAALARDDLTDSERMGSEWHIANTLFHEVMHAFSLLRSLNEHGLDKPIDGANFRAPEPFFEDEALSELGFAMEHHVLGGVAEQMIIEYDMDKPPTLSLGYWIQTIWPSVADLGRESPWTVPLVNPGPIHEARHHPISVSFFEDIRQENFWAIGVRNYGSRIIQLRSVEVAEHRTYNYNLDEESNEYRLTHASSITSRSLYEKGRLATIMSGLSPEDRVAIDWGQKLQEAAVGFREFWKYSMDLESQISSVLDHVQRRLGDEGVDKIDQMRYSQRNIFQSMQIGRLAFAEIAHAGTVSQLCTLQALVQPGQDPHKASRHLLLRFNRGAKIYVKGLENIFIPQRFAGLIRPVREVERDFACDWMALWFSGSDPTCATHEDNEEKSLMVKIIDSRMDHGGPDQYSMKALADFPGVSILFRAVSRMIGGLHIVTKPAAERFKDVKTALDELHYIQDAAIKRNNIAHEWLKFIQDCIDLGLKDLTELHKTKELAAGSTAEEAAEEYVYKYSEAEIYKGNINTGTASPDVNQGNLEISDDSQSYAADSSDGPDSEQ